MKLIITILFAVISMITSYIGFVDTAYADNEVLPIGSYAWELGLYPDSFQYKVEYEWERGLYPETQQIKPEQRYEWERGLYSE
jgi:uncharacterized membrane protein